MIALENLKRVDFKNYEHIPVEKWNWTPAITDLSDLDRKFIEASGSSTTSRNTYSNQMDHGENH